MNNIGIIYRLSFAWIFSFIFTVNGITQCTQFLGEDQVITAGPDQKADLTQLFQNNNFNLQWNATNPASVDPGTYWAFGTDDNGCKDTVIVEVCAKPLIEDKEVTVCDESYVNLYTVYDNFRGLIPEFDTPIPSMVTAGVYKVTVSNYCGGKATATVTVIQGTKPDLGPNKTTELAICTDDKINLTDYAIFPGLIAKWNTPEPESVSPGKYECTLTNSDGCSDVLTVFVKLVSRSTPMKDTTVFTCMNTLGYNLNTVFNRYNYDRDNNYITWLDIINPGYAFPGTYTALIEEQFGCIVKVKVTVKKRDLKEMPFKNIRIVNDPIFTNNRFRSVLVDKNGKIWVGTDGDATTGGLFRFTRSSAASQEGVWEKSSFFQDCSYRDLHSSPLPGDNTIWCASDGNGSSEATFGGVYRIRELNDVYRYGSLEEGSPGKLSSLSVNGLSPASIESDFFGNFSVSLGQSFAPDENKNRILQGGLHLFNATGSNDSWVKIPITNISDNDVFVSASGWRGKDLWVANKRSCNLEQGGCFEPFIEIIPTSDGQITDKNLREFITETNSPLPFSSDPLMIVRSIFTSSKGVTFVGVNNGHGVFALPAGSPLKRAEWVNITSHAIIPLSSVNFNAISEINGQIWIGTTGGILVYDGVGDLRSCASYTWITTDQGLPSNNVTDFAYEEATKSIWVTTIGGLAEILLDFAIVGRVANADIPITDEGISNEIIDIPITGASIELYDNNSNLLSTAISLSNGNFFIGNTEASKSYRIIIKQGSYRYEFNNVKANQNLGTILFPGKLLQDFQNLLNTANEITNIQDYKRTDWWGDRYSVTNTFKFEAFDPFSIQEIFAMYGDPVTEKHNEKINQLAILYRLGLETYRIGERSGQFNGYAAVLFEDIMSTFDNTLANLYGWSNNQRNVSNLIYSDFFEAVTFAFNDKMNSIEAQVAGLSKVTPREKKIYLDLIARLRDSFNEIQNLYAQAQIIDENRLLNLINEVRAGSVHKSLQDLFYQFYFGEKYKDIVRQALLNYLPDEPGENSYLQFCNNIYRLHLFLDEDNLISGKIRSNSEELSDFKNYNLNIEAIRNSFPLFCSDGNTLCEQLYQEFSLAFNKLRLNKPSQLISEAAKFAIWQGRQPDTLLTLIKNPEAELNSFSEKIKENVLSESTVLESVTMNFRKRLQEYQIEISGSFDSARYEQTYLKLLQASNQYSRSKAAMMQRLLAQIASAQDVFPDFLKRMETLTYANDSLSSLVGALLLRSWSHLANNNKSFHVQQLKVLSNLIANNLILLNGEIRNNLKQLQDFNLNSGPLLFKFEQTDSTDYKAGGTGKLSFTFMNVGDEPVQNVRFKITDISGGFNITSTDSIFAGNLMPEGTTTVSFNYASPSRDTKGFYTLKVYADNASIPVTTGTLIVLRSVDNTAPISIKSGLWSDPTTWSTGLVPDATSAVTIRHQVTIDVDATCKSIKAENPAQVQVAAGKKLTVLQ